MPLIRKGNGAIQPITQENNQSVMQGLESLLKPLASFSSLARGVPNIEELPKGASYLGVGALEGLASVLGLPGSIHNFISPSTSFLPTSSTLVNNVGEILSKIIPKDYREPSDLRGHIVKSIGSGIPLGGALIAKGAPVAQTVARTIGSGIGAGLGESVGGPFGALIGSLGGSFAGNKALKWIINAPKTGVDPQTLQSIAEQAEERLYSAEKELGKDINVKYPRYKESLNAIKSKIEDTTALDTGEKKELIEKIDRYLSDYKIDRLNASQLAERSKELNRIKTWNNGKEYNKFIDWTKKVLKETENAIGNKHPEWKKTLEEARDVHKALNFNDYFNDLLSSNKSLGKILTNPLAKLIMSGGAFGTFMPFGGLLKYGAGALAGLGIEKGSQLYGFLKYPSTYPLLEKAFKYSLERNIPALGAILTKLNNKADTFQEESRYNFGGRLIRKGSKSS